jgi:site-specific DNA-methyltransferase (adenine-specific)
MDCLEGMKLIADGSVDMVLCDLPYGTTQNKWDSVIPLETLWKQYWRVIKSNGAILLTAAMPFTATLSVSQLSYFKYAWVWDKVNRKTGHLNAKKQPLRVTEDVLCFYRKQCTYNPVMGEGKPYKVRKSNNVGIQSDNYGKQTGGMLSINDGHNCYPVNLISISADERGTVGRLHPTQKPVALFEYLIRTYSNPGELILDNCIGSGTTAIACINTDRQYIGFELDNDYFNATQERIQNHQNHQSLLTSADVASDLLASDLLISQSPSITSLDHLFEPS